MKTLRTPLLLLLAALMTRAVARGQSPDCPCACPPDETDTSQDPSGASDAYFHEQLTPYGEWAQRPGYGEVWIPHVAASWRPYTTGHWIYTDQGWAWVADESWGWAPFHYGRWFFASGRWGWVPGHVWAPAWVAWRSGGGYVGWAPLPPAVGFSAQVGVNLGGLNIEAVIAPSYYSFVSERAILEPRLVTVIEAPTRNVTFVRNTTNITNITVVNNRVINQGVDAQHIGQVIGHPVPVTRVANQHAFVQPPVIARAARQARTESFVNRPAPPPSAITATTPAGKRANAGANTAIAPVGRPGAHPGAITPTTPVGKRGAGPGVNGAMAPAGKRGAHPDAITATTPAGKRGVSPGADAAMAPTGKRGTHPNAVTPTPPAGKRGANPGVNSGANAATMPAGKHGGGVTSPRSVPPPHPRPKPSPPG